LPQQNRLDAPGAPLDAEGVSSREQDLLDVPIALLVDPDLIRIHCENVLDVRYQALLKVPEAAIGPRLQSDLLLDRLALFPPNDFGGLAVELTEIAENNL
jgi:hypothetical protein